MLPLTIPFKKPGGYTPSHLRRFQHNSNRMVALFTCEFEYGMYDTMRYHLRGFQRSNNPRFIRPDSIEEARANILANFDLLEASSFRTKEEVIRTAIGTLSYSQGYSKDPEIYAWIKETCDMSASVRKKYRVCVVEEGLAIAKELVTDPQSQNDKLVLLQILKMDEALNWLVMMYYNRPQIQMRPGR